MQILNSINTHFHLMHVLRLFGFGSCDEWLLLKNIMDLFLAATGMAISPKSSFLVNNVASDVLSQIRTFLPYRMDNIKLEFRYLGFWLKPASYRVAD